MSNSTNCPDLSDPDMQWPYCPSFTAATAFTALFGTLCLAHLFQAIYYRKRFCWVICMATIWETTGFVFRLLGARDPRNQTYAVGSNLLILLAPLWINAFAYMVVGRMAYYWLPEKKLWKIKARTLTTWFVWLDVITFLVQATGGSMIDQTDPGTAQIGLDVYMGGIGLQQAFVIMFFFLMVRFHLDARREGRSHPTSWWPQLYALYAVLALITIRIIFRLVEFSSGTKGPIPTDETYFYCLEAAPMVIAISIFAVIHPGRTLTGSESEFSKLVVTKGHRRWWCCGRRSRTKVDPDFEMDEWAGEGITRAPSAEIAKVRGESRREGARRYDHHRRSSRRRSDRQYLTGDV